MQLRNNFKALSLNSLYNITFLLIIILFIGFALLGGLIFSTQQKLIESHETRYRSYLLANELRQSSDDLTKFARTYVVTGDPKYEQFYFDILDIRNGIKERPENYERIYWDLVVADGMKPHPDTAAVPLVELMKNAGFTDAEFEMLSEAQHNSDGLVNTEIIAMDAIKGILDQSGAELINSNETLNDLAERIMFDKDYHATKGRIMRPIDHFFEMLDVRTKEAVDLYAEKQNNLLILIAVFLVSMIVLLIGIFTGTTRQLKQNEKHLEQLVLERTSELQASLNNLKFAQTQLVESEKMASLGELVAGVAHEINTPIGIGVTLASHLQKAIDRLETSHQSVGLTRSDFENFIDDVANMAKILLTNMTRAGDLIKSFKQIAIDQSIQEMRVFKLNEYISEILLSLNSKFKHTKYSIIVTCPETLAVNSYPSVIYQIITNLLMNSLIHGFSGMTEGCVTIDICRIEDRIRIIYKDTGQGMSPEIVDKIFDPFFTTNRGRGGSGLGLHIVYTLTTQVLSGTIECQSLLGEGTTFTIEFPCDQIFD